MALLPPARCVSDMHVRTMLDFDDLAKTQGQLIAVPLSARRRYTPGQEVQLTAAVVCGWRGVFACSGPAASSPLAAQRQPHNQSLPSILAVQRMFGTWWMKATIALPPWLRR